MECYVVLYSQEGFLLTFTKRSFSYFSMDEINSNGILLEGSSQFTFPERIFYNDEEPFKACLKALTSECGKEITFDFFPNLPQSISTLKSMIVNGTKHTILRRFLKSLGSNSHTLYLQFTTDHLRAIHNSIENTNIAEANRARIAIYNNVIQNYEQIFIYHQFCPLNDKLFNAQLWQIVQEIDKIRLLSKSKVTDRYFKMIVYLANGILNANIGY